MANKSLILESDMDLENKTRMMLLCVAQEEKVEMTRRLAPFGISMQQLHILHTLCFAPKDGLTVNQLKAMSIDDSANVSRALNKLVDQGLVIKTRSDEDQRIVTISVTQKGQETHRQADENLITMKLPLSQEETNQLFGLLKKL